MSEKLIKERNKELSGWTYNELSLAEVKSRIDELISQYGENAYIYISGGDGAELEIYWHSIETDEEYQKRLTDEEAKRNYEIHKASALQKLTPEERAALKRHPFSW